MLELRRGAGLSHRGLPALGGDDPQLALLRRALGRDPKRLLRDEDPRQRVLRHHPGQPLGRARRRDPALRLKPHRDPRQLHARHARGAVHHGRRRHRPRADRGQRGRGQHRRLSLHHPVLRRLLDRPPQHLRRRRLRLQHPLRGPAPGQQGQRRSRPRHRDRGQHPRQDPDRGLDHDRPPFAQPARQRQPLGPGRDPRASPPMSAARAPRSYAGYRLKSGSLGMRKASDGLNIGHASRRSLRARRGPRSRLESAAGGSRTPTSLRTRRPERRASTSSATAAVVAEI